MASIGLGKHEVGILSNYACALLAMRRLPEIIASDCLLSYVTRSVKINHVSAQNCCIFCCVINSYCIYGNRMKLIPDMQKFMENLIKLTELNYLF